MNTTRRQCQRSFARKTRGSWLLTRLFAPVIAVVTVTSATSSIARAEVAKADCTITAVHAKKEGDGKIPPSLQFLEAQLREDPFTIYKGFRLLDKKTLKLEKGKPGSAAMKSGHSVKLSLLGGDSRLKLDFELGSRTGDKPLVSTIYTIENGGVILFGGPKFEDGVLLFAVQCAARG